MNQSLNQAINPSSHQSINQSINRNHLNQVNESINQSIYQNHFTVFHPLFLRGGANVERKAVRMSRRRTQRPCKIRNWERTCENMSSRGTADTQKQKSTLGGKHRRKRGKSQGRAKGTKVSPVPLGWYYRATYKSEPPYLPSCCGARRDKTLPRRPVTSCTS